MGDDNTNTKKRKTKWITSYSSMTIPQAQERLGFRIRTIKTVSVDEMLADNKDMFGEDRLDIILKTKQRIYDNVVDYVLIEGYPTEGDPDFKEGNINDLVYSIINPIVASFIRMTGRTSIQLRREKEIISVDGETGGTEEFVMVDLVSVTEEKFVFIVEAKRSSLGLAMKQCLLSMKDAWDNNGGGILYGFVTTGESWQMIRYDGISFKITEKMDVLFGTMGENQQRWIKEYSILVDCMYMALANGGVKKDVVVF